MKTRSAFTMIELIFVIVVMGIIGKFGVEFLAQAYRSFIFSSVNNSLQAKSASAVEFIATRLQYRIKDSLIARVDTNTTAVGIGSASGTTYTVLEWVSMDIDGYRGTTTPNWSGIADLDPGQALGQIESPGTETNTTNALIDILSYTDKTINDAALYFIGSNSDVINDYGWSGALVNQTGAMHPINSVAGQITRFAPPTAGDFTGIDIYEYYKLAWTANAVVHEDADGDGNEDDLVFYYDYQPWNGDTLADAKQAVIINDVATFQFTAIGSIIKIQVCANSDLVEDYSLCKEKTVF